MIKKFTTPILFIIFNRKDVAITAFEKIRKVKPQKLYIAGDGARKDKEGENLKVEDTRNTILNLIDWPCEVKTLFQEENIGCGTGVFTAINWLFENEESGIVLEDDCVVQDSFFPYMEELLNLYAKDSRIGMIAGYNSLGTTFNEFSYCFSKYKGCWGWATWRRAWENMDIALKWRETSESNSIIENMGYKNRDKKEWLYKLKKIDNKTVSAWDWQWYFSLASQNQLCIFPSVSLVSNIGFGEDATHTQNNHSEGMNAKYELHFPLKHPDYILPNMQFDKMFYKKTNSIVRKIRTYLPTSLNSKTKTLLNKIIPK